MNFSSITLGGRFVKDPEAFTTANTNGVNFTIAVNTYTGGKGNDKNRVDYFDCVAWGKRAEAIAEHCAKGSSILVEGEPRIEKYEVAGDGGASQKRQSFKVLVNKFSFAGATSSESASESAAAASKVPF